MFFLVIFCTVCSYVHTLEVPLFFTGNCLHCVCRMESSVQSSEPTEPSDSSATGSVGVGQKTLLGICSSKELLRDPLPGSTVEPVEKAIRHTEREGGRVTDKPCDTLDSSREVCEVGRSEVGGGVDGSVTCEEEEEEEEENVCRETRSSDGGVCDEGGEGGSSSEKRVSGSEESLKLEDSGQTDEGGGRQSEGEGGKDDERDMESTTPVESLSTAETVESPTEGEGEREAVKTGSEGRGGSDGEGEPMEEEDNECLGKVDTEDIEDRNDEVIGSLTNETPVGERGEVTENQEVSAAALPAKERDGVAGGGDTVDEKEVVEMMECSDLAEPGIVEPEDSNQTTETTVGEKEDFELTENQEAVVEQEDSENLAETSEVEREDSAETGVGEQENSKQISSPTAAELDVTVDGERVAADPDLPSAVPTTAPSVVSSSHLHQVTSPPSCEHTAVSSQSLTPSHHHTLTSSQPAAAPSAPVSLWPSSTSPHSPTLTSPRPHTLTSPQSHTLTSPQSLVSPHSPTTTTDTAASPHSPTSHTLPSSQPHNVTSPRHHTLTPPQTHSTSSPQPESPSQPPTVTSSQPHTVTSSHPHTVTSSHPHTVTSSHPHTVTSTPPHIVTTSQLSTITCPPSHTVTSSLSTLTNPSAPDAQPANESSPSTDCGNEREPENEVGDERKVEADTTSLPEEKQPYSRAANTMEQMQEAEQVMTETTVEPSAEPSGEPSAVSGEKEGQDNEGESAAIVAEMTVPDAERAVEEQDKVVEEDSGRPSEMAEEEDGDVNVEERDAVGEGAGEGLQSEQREMEVRAIQPPSELTTLEEMKGEEEGGMEVEMEGEGDTRSSVVHEKEERLDRHNGDTESGSNPESGVDSTATGERSNLLGTTVTPCPQGDEASGETEEAKKLVETEDSSTTPPTTSTDSSDVVEKGEQESLVVLVSSASGPLQPTEGHTEQEEEVDTSGDKDEQTLTEVAAAPLSTAPTTLFSPAPLTDTGPSVGYLPVTTSQPAVGQSHENTTSSPQQETTNVVVVGTGSTSTAASISPPPPLTSDPSSSSSSGPREKVLTELTQVDTTSIAPEKKTQVAVVAALAPTTSALPSLSSTSSTVHSVGDTCLIENSSINEVDSVETSTTSPSLKQDRVNPELPFATSSLPVPTVTSSLPTPLPLGSVPSTSSGRPDQDKPLIEPTQVDATAPEENPVFVTTHSATISSSVQSKRATVERVIVPSPKRRASDPSSPPPPGSPPSLSSHTHTSGLRRSASDGASPQPSIPTRGAIMVSSEETVLVSSEETVLVSSGETGVVHEATQTPPSTRTTFPSLPTAPVADVGMSPPTRGISSDRFCVTPPSGNEATPTRVTPSVATPSVQIQTMPTQHSSPVRAVASFSRTVNQQRSNTASVVTTPQAAATSSSGSTAAHTTFSPFSLPISTTASPTNTAATTAGAQANTAGAQANTAGAQANTAGAQANTAGAQANTAGAQANTAGAQATNTAGAQANTAGAQATNTAGAQANTAGAQATNTAGAQATNTGGAGATNTAGAQAQFPAGYQPVIQVTPSGTIMTLVPTSQLKLASMQLSQQASTAAAAEKKKMAASSSSGIRPTAVAGMTKFDLSERKRALNMVHPDLLKVFGKPHFTSVQRMAVPKPQTLESTEMRKITSQQTDLPAVAAVASQTEPTTPGKVSSVADTAQPSTQGFKLSITTVSSSSSSSSSSPSSSSSSSRGVLDGGVESSDKSRQLSAPVARVPVVVGSTEGGRREAGPERAQLGGAKTAEKLMVQKAEILGACEYSKNVI